VNKFNQSSLFNSAHCIGNALSKSNWVSKTLVFAGGGEELHYNFVGKEF